MASFQKYFVSGIAGILVIVLIVGTAISLTNKSGFADQNANANSNPQVNISESQLAIASYVGMGLLVVAGVAILAIYLHPRV
jgi:hypothetical protein